MTIEVYSYSHEVSFDLTPYEFVCDVVDSGGEIFSIWELNVEKIEKFFEEVQDVCSSYEEELHEKTDYPYFEKDFEVMAQGEPFGFFNNQWRTVEDYKNYLTEETERMKIFSEKFQKRG